MNQVMKSRLFTLARFVVLVLVSVLCFVPADKIMQWFSGF
jgi:hypothetical protein